MNLDCPRTNEEFEELARQVVAIAARCLANLRPGTLSESYWSRIHSNSVTLSRLARDGYLSGSPADDYRDLKNTIRGDSPE